MRTVMAGLLALSLGGLALALDDQKAGEQSGSRADRLKAIQKASAAATSAAAKAFQDAKTDEEKTAARAAFTKASNEARAKALKDALALAKEDPKDDVGFDAAMYAFTMSVTDPKAREQAFKVIADHHVANPKIERVVGTLTARPGPAEKAFLEAALQKNPSPAVKATISLGMAKSAQREANSWKLSEADMMAKRKEVVEKLEAVARQYGDVELTLPKGKVADAVKKELDAFKESPVGKETPEIEGEDTDGQKFKISDYRGKVVLLDFWGHW
jgi:hypothetical protein